MSWLLHLLDEYGITDSSNRWGAFWSGFCSDLGNFTLIGALVAFWRKHSCHVDYPKFCWRWGAHPVPGTAFKTCRRHHPTVPDRVTADHIADAHRDAQSPTN
jgi:hypothetical protein